MLFKEIPCFWYGWLLPTSYWDDFIGRESQDMANEISTILSTLTSIMKLENHWRQKTLKNLEKDFWNQFTL